MKQEIFAIGDVHGEITLFKEMLQNWDEETQQLVLIGDLGDRGENPKECFALGNSLVAEKGAICLRGNHEEMLLGFLRQPEENYSLYAMNGGGKTIETFLHPGAEEEYSAVEIAGMIKSHYPWLEVFLENCLLYYEWEDYIFVHAGVDLAKKDWKKTAAKDFVWIREGFYDQKNKTGKKIVFGHTITPMLYGDNETTDVWTKNDLIGIDGGAVYGGALHGVRFDKTGIVKDYAIPNKNKGLWE
ncbi:metallophosphoesterase [Desemzia sp. FAM 23991]|uniref:metallophosphoesterase n=1 Tax=unclassified Desemzia TaxID=2685243 RepID=UPI003889801B